MTVCCLALVTTIGILASTLLWLLSLETCRVHVRRLLKSWPGAFPLRLVMLLVFPVAGWCQTVVPVNVKVTPQNATVIDLVQGVFTFAVPTGATPATGSVTVLLDGQTTVSASLLNGTADVVLGQLATGSHNAAYTYSGDSHYAAATGTTTFTVVDTTYHLAGSSYAIQNLPGNNVGVAVDSHDNAYFVDISSDIYNTVGGHVRKRDFRGNVTEMPFTGLNAPQALAIGAADTLYLADTGNSRIVSLTQAGVQTVLAVTGLVQPTSLAFDPSRQNLYIVDNSTSNLLRFNLAAGTTTVAASVFNLTDVAVDPAGNVYYTARAGFSLPAQPITRIDTAGNSANFPVPAGDAQQIAFDASGSLYFTTSFAQRNTHANADGGTLRVDAAGHFSRISGLIAVDLATDSHDRVYLGGSQLFSPQAAVDGGPVTAWDGGDSGQSNMTLIYSVATGETLSTLVFTPATHPFDNYGHNPNIGPSAGTDAATCGSLNDCIEGIFQSYDRPGINLASAAVTTSLNHTIATQIYGAGIQSELAFTPGTATAATPLAGTGATGYSAITGDQGVSAGLTSGYGGGNLYFTAPGSKVIRQVTAAAPSTVLSQTTDPSLVAPTQLALDAENILYVLDSNGRILSIPVGASTGSVAFDVAGQSGLGTLTAFTLDASHTLWLGGADGSGNGAIARQDALGNLSLYRSGIPVPTALAADVYGVLYAGFASDGSLRTFSPDGTSTTLATGLGAITAIGLEPSGAAYVATGTGNLTEVQPNGTKVPLPTVGIGQAAAVFVDDRSNIAVGDASNGNLVAVDRAFSPAYSFGNQAVNTVSAVMHGAFVNAGTLPLNFGSLPGDATFALVSSGGTCALGSALQPGTACEQDFTFNPTAAQSYSESGYLSTDTPTSSTTFHSYALAFTGTGVAAQPTAALSPGALSFSGTVGSSVANQVVTLGNTGSGPLTIGSVAIAGSGSAAFAQTSTCGATLAAAATCTITIAYTPSAAGTSNATLTVTDDSGSAGTVTATQLATLTGTVTAAPLATLTPPMFAFGNVSVGSSAFTVFTLANNGNAALSVASVSLNGAGVADFSQTNNCGSSVAAGGSCSITVVYSPSLVGSQGNITLTVADGAGTQTSSISGAAAVTGGLVIQPAQQIFPDTAVGSTSGVQISTLSNIGSQAVYLSPGTLTDATDFSVTNTCGGLIAGGASCTIRFTFKPQTGGAQTSTFEVHNLNSPPIKSSRPVLSAVRGAFHALDTPTGANSVTVVLSGNGTAAASPQAALLPATESFTAAVGSTSAVQTATLTNAGTATLNIAGLAVGGANATVFSIANSACGPTLLSGASCQVTVQFKPLAGGSFTASLVATDNAGLVSGSMQSVALNGTATVQTAPIASLTPAVFTFATAAVGSTSAAATFTLANTGTAPLPVSSVTLTGTGATQFTIVGNTCGSSLAAGATCTVLVTFTPASAASTTASLVFSDTAGTQTAALSGSGATSASLSDFTIAATPALQSAYRGATVTYTVQLNSVSASNPFTSAVALNATGLPAGATAAFSPMSVVPGTGATAILSVHVPALYAINAPQSPQSGLTGIAAAGLLLLLLPLRKRRHIRLLLMLCVLAIVCTATTGCGSGNGFATPTTQSTITISGTSGVVTHTASVSLTVQ